MAMPFSITLNIGVSIYHSYKSHGADNDEHVHPTHTLPPGVWQPLSHPDAASFYSFLAFLPHNIITWGQCFWGISDIEDTVEV